MNYIAWAVALTVVAAAVALALMPHARHTPPVHVQQRICQLSPDSVRQLITGRISMPRTPEGVAALCYWSNQ